MTDTASPDNSPRVSVVIPTFRRPDLVRRAAASALAQSVADLEVVVVIDGDDPADADATRASLDALAGPRLKVVAAGRQLGNGAARNLGVDHARGGLIAFLDDDDEWMRTKLERQMPLAGGDATLVTCRLEARAGDKTFAWPRRLPREGERIDEYLFCPSRPGTGEGLVQTSTWLAPASLLRRVRFDAGLKRYVDLDWILRAAAEPSFAVRFAGWPEPLCVWNIEPGRRRVSTADDGGFALDFAKQRRDAGLLSGRGYAGFVLGLASQSAAAAGRRPGYWRLLAASVEKGGRPTAAGLLGHTLHYAVPRALLARAAAMLSGSATSR